ncbi:MAG: RNA-binding transcriptional accessory protein [Calditrichaeota bacterium]|nr:MAG: RNA-binding transcriptional accessory protein [Calditrichota bacterium]
MKNIAQQISTDLNLNFSFVRNALNLFEEGSTVPFIARYRKEKTGSLNEIQLREIFEKFTYYTELENRKQTILQTISEQGKLTDELKTKIESSLLKNELEDLYLPFKPKRRTRATIAKENGLEPFAEFIKSQNVHSSPKVNLVSEAKKYLSKNIETPEDAIIGASDILAEEISEIIELRSFVRDEFWKNGFLVSKKKGKFEGEQTKFDSYKSYKSKLGFIAPHSFLAILRGEEEGFLSVKIEVDENKILDHFDRKLIFSKDKELYDFYQKTNYESFDRLFRNSISSEIRQMKKEFSDKESILNFGKNLRDLLLSSPAGMKTTIGIDPGFRTGCKVVVIDSTGKFLEYQNIFPHTSRLSESAVAYDTLCELIEKHEAKLIAIGNGTASRETDKFVTEVLEEFEEKPIKVTVSESGASIYSASEVAIEEFPNLDLTVRGAISIARRLQDPLAELVKIDPKSIGVGQYQHDVDQKLLKTKLDETVESCVNFVGVDLNTASKELLSFVSGINKSVALNIVNFRNQNGAFQTREELKKIPRFGAKAFEQASGFLRIRNGENPLDNTAVHPESYFLVENIAKDLKLPLKSITQNPAKLKDLDIKKYVTEEIGEPTLVDILEELQKPGRDPREEFSYAKFDDKINEISDLSVGMILEGIVTNVTNFGAFVDIGVHQDGLVHVSQLANKFVKDPTQIVKVGQIVKVKVTEVNEKLKRIQLSMKAVS